VGEFVKIRRFPGIALAAALTVGGCSDSGPALPGEEPDLGLEFIASEFDFPLALTAPTGDPRLFIVEKAGRIRIVSGGTTLAEPFLDISHLVSASDEQGLLGLAFHPGYATNGRFYVNYTDLDGATRVVGYRVSSDPDRADPGTADPLLTIPRPSSNHNGGALAFGPDGFLYVAVGDGGAATAGGGTGQDVSDLAGSILRIDVASATGYAIPGSNPFANQAGARGEVWSLGLRNPWRISFDRETGDLYVADVGQNNLEEVNVSPRTSGGGRAANYGWSVTEGSSCFDDPGCDPGEFVLPVVEYDHDDGCSVTGGYVYRGAAMPALAGRYFYADFCSGWVRSFRLESGQAVSEREWPELGTVGQISSFGEDAEGELYILNASGGSVYRIVPR
jgi:glucose/arabinose dehydrogenase